MIVYGSNATHLKSDQLRNANCPNCNERGKLTASVFSRHAHVFWIPFFPIGKVGVFECQNCHKGFKKKELNEDGKREYKNFLTDVKIPLWKYSGLGLVALLISWFAYSDSVKDDKVTQFIEKPAMFDTYIFKTESANYSTFKITEIFQDSMYVNYNLYETNKLTGVSDINIKKNYEDIIYVLTNADIKVLHESGDIKDIERN